jgi:hypothetical protein
MSEIDTRPPEKRVWAAADWLQRDLASVLDELSHHTGYELAAARYKPAAAPPAARQTG